jgi:ribosomal protein S18 acetylase RimI-like enzyme
VNSNAVQIRRGEASDAAVLAPFAAKLFLETYADSTPAADLATYVAKSFQVDHLRTEISDPAGAVFLGQVASGSLAGYAHVVFAGEQPAFLNRLYVATEFKGSGLAHRLLEEVIQACRRLKVERLNLTVFEQNARAIAFYKRSGFLEIGLSTFKVGNEIQTDVEMALPIGSP